MERNVEYRLTVVKDRNSKRAADQVAKEVIESSKRADDERVQSSKRSNREIARDRQASINREKRMRQEWLGETMRTERKAAEAARAARRERLANLRRERQQQEAAEKKRLAAIQKEAEAFKKAEKAKRDEMRRTSMAYRMGERVRELRAGGAGGMVRGMGMPSIGGAMSMSRIGGAVAGGPMGIASLVGGGALAMGASAGMNAFAELEQTQVRLEALLGSANETRDAIKELRELGMSSGLRFNGLTDALATMSGFNVETDVARQKLKEIAAITAGDNMRLQRLSLAFAQAAGNGRLMGEELNQMIDAGFNPLMSISDRTGESIAELRKRMADGKLTIKELEQAFTDVTSEGGRFGSMLEKMGDTVSVQMGRTAQKSQEFKVAIGRALQNTGVAEMGMDFASGAMDVGTITLDLAYGTRAQREDAFIRMKQQEMGANYNPAANDTSDKALVFRRLKMDEEIAALAKKREDAEKRIADQKARAAERARQADMLRLSNNAKELVDARELTDIRVKGAKEELDLRREALATAQQEAAEARQQYQNARERFGSMSREDQQSLVQTVMRGRQDTRSLSREEIQQLQSFGSLEARDLASRALQFRSSAQFAAAGGANRQDIALRESLFARERQQVQRTAFEESKITADVQQQIQFVASFDQTSKQIADRVTVLMKEALNKQAEDVIEMIQPLYDAVETQRRRNRLMNTGRS